MVIQVDFDNRIRYKLDGRVVTDPVGWLTDEKEYARNETYYGIISNFTNNLQFVKDAANYITDKLEAIGIDADIELTRDERNPTTDIWETQYTGYLDLSTYTLEDRKVNVKCSSGGLEKIIKARENEKIEISRPLNMDGAAITQKINPIDVLVKGKSILISSLWESKVDDTDNFCHISDASRTGANNVTATSIPMPITSNTEGEDSEIIKGAETSTLHSSVITNGSSGMMFYDNAKQDHKGLKIKLDITGVLQESDIGWIDSANLKFILAKFKGGNVYTYDSAVSVLRLIPDFGSLKNERIKSQRLVFDGVVDLKTGESLGLIMQLYVDFKDRSGGERPHIDVTYEKITGKMSVIEDSFAPDSSSKAYLYNDVMKQIVNIAAGDRYGFKSVFLNSSLFAMTHGLFLRQFAETADKFKPLTTSFKDAFESLDSVMPMGSGIEFLDGRETVVVEPIDYFFNRNVTIKLGQVSKVKRSIAQEQYYNSLSFGTKIDITYTEANGLDEFNTRTFYSTAITRIKNVYEKLSAYRKDATGKELARRSSFKDFGTTDTTYDNNIWMLDLKTTPTKGLYQEKGYHDNGYTSVTGIYSPETSNGFFFSAKQCLLRHSKMLSPGLIKKAINPIMYASSAYNSELSLNGVKESDSVQINQMDQPLYRPIWIEFEYSCNFATLSQVKGSTIIGGVKVVNFYGLVEFINEYGMHEKGFLFNLKPNNAGEWRLLKY